VSTLDAQNEEAEAGHIALFMYLHTRQRCGVVGNLPQAFKVILLRTASIGVVFYFNFCLCFQALKAYFVKKQPLYMRLLMSGHVHCTYSAPRRQE
jgi:hypothetical protein